jgi:hypothetical protein
MPALPQETSVPVSTLDIKTPDDCPPGRPFIPHKAFPTGIFIPDVLLANPKLSLGAKLLWGRLARYAGADGACFPAAATLALDLGCSERQVQRYVAELTRARYIAARQRGFNRSNLYQFLWHPDLESPPRKPPSRTTDASSSPSTTEVSSSPSTTEVSSSSTTQTSSLRADFKSFTKVQATHAREAEPVPKSPACPSPRRPRPKPPTPQDTDILEQLRRFQTDLAIGGRVDDSTVREVLKIVEPGQIPSALKLVADKLWERRRRDPSYRRRVDFGFVLTVLRQDWSSPTRPIQSPIHTPLGVVPEPEGIPVALPPPEAMSGPPRYQESFQGRRSTSRDPFRRAGDLLKTSGILDQLKER